MPAVIGPRIAAESPAHYVSPHRPPSQELPGITVHALDEDQDLRGMSQAIFAEDDERQGSNLQMQIFGVGEEVAQKISAPQATPAKENDEIVDYPAAASLVADFEEFLKEQLTSTQRNLTKCVVENQRRMTAAVTKKTNEICSHFSRQNTVLQSELLQLHAQVKEMSIELEASRNSVFPSVVTAPGAVIAEDDSILGNSLTSFKSQGFSKQSFNANMASVPVPLMILAHRQPPTLALPDPDNTGIVATPPAMMASTLTSQSLVKGTRGNMIKQIKMPAYDAITLAPYDSKSQVEPTMTTAHRGTDISIASSFPREVTFDDYESDGNAWSNKRASNDSNPRPLARRGTMREAATKFFANGGIQPVGVFADAESMKEKVRQAIGKQEYSVQNFYKTTGIAQWIARSPIFDNATIVVIALNALWIGIDTDYNKHETVADSELLFQVGEHLFCAFFVTEWVIRLAALKRFRDGIHDYWFVFDAILVVLMVLETWIMSAVLAVIGGPNAKSSDHIGNASILKLFKLLRLTRVARMVRLLRAIPELMILIKGISVATRSVFFTLCLLVVIMYIFAIAFTQLAKDECCTGIGPRYFETVLASMNTLLLYGTFLEDTPDVINAIGDESNLLRVLFLVFILLASLTVMNMLVGVLVEVVSVVSSVEKEQLQVNFVKSRLAQIIDDYALDANADGKVSKAEFEMLLSNQEAARALRDVGVDVVGLVDFHDFLFQDGQDSFSFENFMQVVLSLRGTNKSTVKDIVDLRKFIMSELARIENKLTIMLESCGASASARKLSSY